MNLMRRLLSRSNASPMQVRGRQVIVSADRITGLSDGDAVAAWADVSGHGRTFSQGTGSAQPAYETDIINGLPVVRFDTDEYLQAAEFMNFTDWTLIAVASTGASGTQTIFSDYGVPAGSQMAQLRGVTGTMNGIVRDGSNNSITATGGSSTAMQVVVLRLDAKTVLLWQNGGAPASATNASYLATTLTGTFSAPTIGAIAGPANYLNGDVATLMIYAFNASAGRFLQRLMGRKYALTIG